MSMKLEFEAEIKNAAELARFFRETEKDINSVTLSSEGFTKSMISGFEAIQKASSSTGLGSGMKKSFEEFGKYKELAKELSDIFRVDFAESTKKAADVASASFKQIGKELENAKLSLSILAEGSKEYIELLDRIKQKTIQFEAAAINSQELNKIHQMYSGGGDAPGGTKVDKDKDPPSVGGIMRSMGIYTAAAMSALYTGNKIAQYEIAQTTLPMRSQIAQQRTAAGGLEAALGGDFSEILAEEFGHTGRIRSGNLTLMEKYSTGMRNLRSWGTKDADILIEEEAQERLGIEKEMYKHHSQGMKHRVRISSQFRGLGQTYGDVTDQYAGIQEQHGVGQEGMDQMFGVFQSMQMNPRTGEGGPGSMRFYQGMKKYGVSPEMMTQAARMQRSGRTFNADEAGGLLTSLMGAAGLQNPDIVTRQYVTREMAKAMGANPSDTYALGETGRILGATKAALGEFQGLNPKYVTENAISAMNSSFAPVKQDGSYENSLMREQLRSMGLDSTAIDLWFKTGGPTNAAAMEDMAFAVGMSPQSFKDTLYEPIKNFHDGQRDIMGSATSGGIANKWLSKVRSRWVAGREGDQAKFYEKQYAGSILTKFAVDGKSYSNNAEGYKNAARDKLAKQSTRIGAYEIGKAGTIDEAAMRLDPEQYEQFAGSTISAGSQVDASVQQGKRTTSQTMEEKTAAIMSTLTKLLKGEEGTVFKRMDNNLQRIADKIGVPVKELGKPEWTPGRYQWDSAVKARVWIPGSGTMTSSQKASDDLSKSQINKQIIGDFLNRPEFTPEFTEED